MALVHTEVDPAHEGHGLGSLLVAGAIRELRERGLRVIPVCPYVRSWLLRHAEQTDIVIADPALP